MKKLLVAAVSLCAVSLLAQSVIPNNPGRKQTVAIRNATIHPVTSPSIQRGTIVFSNGVITAVGADTVVPEGAAVIDGSGLHVYPGFIDSGTQIGLTEISSVRGTNDVTELGEINPNARAAVAINPHSNLIPVTRVNGVLSVISHPTGSLISGQGALIRLAGWTPDEMVIRSPVAVYLNFPRAYAGTFSDRPQDEEAEKKAKREYGDRLQMMRETLRDARSYARVAALAKPPAGFERDVILESLIPAVEGKVPFIAIANRAADIRAALKFADEEKIRLMISGGAEVQRVLPELKKNSTPVLLGPIYSLPPMEDDPYDLIFTNAAALHQAGIPFAIQTQNAHDVRNLPYEAAACVAFGLPRDEAVKAITIYPARLFGVDDRLGSLEVGKAATLFLSDGDPLEVRTNVKQVFIDGEQISMDTLHTLLYEKFRTRPGMR